MKSVLITGGTGCIGASAARVLAGLDVDEIAIASRSGSPGTLRLWFGENLDPRIRMMQGDVSDEETVREWMRTLQPTHILHLGAFQTPDCEAYPWRGMEINVGGTMRLLNAAAELCTRLERFVVASSAAVYGARADYPGPVVKETDPLLPPNYYGVWKVADEHLARLYHRKTGVPTVCLRLNTTYGKGRDKGKTSAPTTAMKAVALGAVQGRKVPFRMPYFGRENYHFVADVGAHFAACALDPFAGFGVFNIRGRTVEVREFLGLIERAAAELGMADYADIGIAEDAEQALFIYDLDDTAVQRAFPGVPRTPLEDGIRRSLEDFREMARRGELASI